MNERKSGLEAGKMYIEVNPYKEPESRYVFQVEWAGVKPDRKDWGDRGIHIFGFITRSYPGDAWELYITTEFTEKNKDETWSEAVWDKIGRAHV